MKSRRTRVSLIYEGTDISADISASLLSITYTDNAHGKADDITITLQDKKELWREDWMPQKGATINVSFETKDWRAAGDEMILPCGSFSIDEITLSGPPGVVEIKAISIPTKSSLQNEKKNRSWEGISLSGIAGDIAKNNGIELLYDAVDPLYERRDQRDESDLAFLQRLCEEAGCLLKVTDERLVVFEEKTYEQNSVGLIIQNEAKKVGSNAVRYSFSSSLIDVYGRCKVKYYDPVKKTEQTHIYTVPNSEEGKTLVINKRVESLAEAMNLAQKELRKKNKKQVTGNVTLIGDLRIVAGINVGIKGWGHFDGKYFVDKAIHSYQQGVFATAIEIHRVLEGY